MVCVPLVGAHLRHGGLQVHHNSMDLKQAGQGGRAGGRAGGEVTRRRRRDEHLGRWIGQGAAAAAWRPTSAAVSSAARIHATPLRPPTLPLLHHAPAPLGRACAPRRARPPPATRASPPVPPASPPAGSQAEGEEGGGGATGGSVEGPGRVTAATSVLPASMPLSQPVLLVLASLPQLLQPKCLPRTCLRTTWAIRSCSRALTCAICAPSCSMPARSRWVCSRVGGGADNTPDRCPLRAGSQHMVPPLAACRNIPTNCLHLATDAATHRKHPDHPPCVTEASPSLRPRRVAYSMSPNVQPWPQPREG